MPILVRGLRLTLRMVLCNDVQDSLYGVTFARAADKLLYVLVVRTCEEVINFFRSDELDGLVGLQRLRVATFCSCCRFCVRGANKYVTYKRGGTSSVYQ